MLACSESTLESSLTCTSGLVNDDSQQNNVIPDILESGPSIPNIPSNDSSNFEQALATYLSSLYGNPTLPRSICQSVVDNLINLLNNSLVPSINNVLDQYTITDEIKNGVMLNITDLIISSFVKLKSEHNRMLYFSKMGTFIAPEPVRIGERLDRVKKK